MSDIIDPYICPTRLEAQQILNAAELRKQTGSKAAIRDWIFVKISFNTGLRRSEIGNLKCKHILLSRSELHVAFGKTAASRRVIPLNAETLQAILEYKAYKIEWGEGWDPEEPFLRSPISRSHFDNSTFYRSFKRVLVLATGIEYPQRFRPHSMRHSFATTAYENTCDIKLVSALLGHTSIATTARIYIHLFGMKRKIDAVKNLYRDRKRVGSNKQKAVPHLYSL